MDFHLLPVHRGDPPIEVPKTPYVCTERYDGGPWLSYPARKGKAGKFKAGSVDLVDYARSERIHPTPIKEKESFFQTWLYFGLITEFMGVNSNDFAQDSTLDELMKFIYDNILVQDGDQTYLKLDDDCLDKLLFKGKERISPDPLVQRQHYENMMGCLSYAHPLISTIPVEFNWSIKWSICALGELCTVAVRAGLAALGVPNDFSRVWSMGFLNDEAKASMREHGWCRSDIARTEAKYQSIQGLYMARMLDKSRPKRDHTLCTDSTCNSYQIVPSEYETKHQKLPCSCEELVVTEESVLPILLDGDYYPLLKFEGEGDHLNCEIIKSSTKPEGKGGDLTSEVVKSETRPYVAISHVWADGLGNPNANSLHKCKLEHLRNLVQAIPDGPSTTASETKERPLIWLDTLCCPAKPGKGKQKSIEKIRLVYRQAKHVLILDAGLMAYDSKIQQPPEIVSRIFTSGWMRRLWTLQEGALATSLYFQFADKAVNLIEMVSQTWAIVSSVRHCALQRDLIHEMRGLSAFFNTPNPLSSADHLNLLDRALQFRSVSVASDEPLCIATLLSIDLPSVLKLETQESRMEKVWELILAKNSGVPSQIIFFEESKLSQPGWRWAPKTLLNSQQGLQALNTRIMRWFDPQLATREHLHGLRVTYPGVRIFLKPDYGDGKPRNPWIGAPRLPEDWIQYRSMDNGRWYRIMDKKFAAIHNSKFSDADRTEYHKREGFALHKVADTGKSVLVLNNTPGFREVLFGTTVEEGRGDFQEDVPVAITTEIHGIHSDLGEESYIYDVVERIALDVRADEVTDKHLQLCKDLGIDEQTSPAVFKDMLANHKAFIASTASVKERIKEKLAEVVKVDEKFVRCVDSFWGVPYREFFWVVIRNFFHHDYLGRRTGEKQVWWVD